MSLGGETDINGQYKKNRMDYTVFLPELKAKREEGLKRQPHQRA